MKKVLAFIAASIMAVIMAATAAACGGGGTGPLDTPENFSIDGTGKYSFDSVSGADRYSLDIYSADDYDVKTNTVAEGASAVFSSTLRNNSGTVAGLSDIAWDSYVAVLQAVAGKDSGREDSDVATATFAKGGKLSTPEFWVFAGTAGGFGPGPGSGEENPPAPDGGGEEAPAMLADAETPEMPGEGGGNPPASGEGGGFPGMGGSDSDSSPQLYIVINTDNYLMNAFATEAVFSFAYEVYADIDMKELLYEEDVFADNIQPASFTLYSGNEATIDISDYWSDEDVTWYVRVKANGNAERNVEESEWTKLFRITFNNKNTVPFDYGFGRASNMGGSGNDGFVD